MPDKTRAQTNWPILRYWWGCVIASCACIILLSEAKSAIHVRLHCASARTPGPWRIQLASSNNTKPWNSQKSSSWEIIVNRRGKWFHTVRSRMNMYTVSHDGDGIRPPLLCLSVGIFILFLTVGNHVPWWTVTSHDKMLFSHFCRLLVSDSFSRHPRRHLLRVCRHKVAKKKAW